MTHVTLEKLIELASKANQSARKRVIGKEEAVEILSLIEKYGNDKNINIIRVYSFQGFVPKSYRYPCPIRYFQATRKGDEFEVAASYCDAKRSLGKGSLVTVSRSAKIST